MPSIVFTNHEKNNFKFSLLYIFLKLKGTLVIIFNFFEHIFTFLVV